MFKSSGLSYSCLSFSYHKNYWQIYLICYCGVFKIHFLNLGMIQFYHKFWSFLYVFDIFYRRAYNSQRARSMKKKFKAFSAPPFVLKAVMAGQVGENLTFWYYNLFSTGRSERLVHRH